MNNYSLIHCHSYFSFADSVIDPKRLVKKLKECNIDRIAITDHGNIHHIFRFAKILKENNITYFPGCEFYLTNDIKQKDKDNRKNYHLIIIAKNKQGLKNLYKLSSISYLEGFYYKPRIDFELLKKYNEGLVVSSACIQGKVSSLILEDKYEEAKQEVMRFKSILGDRYFIEIMPHALEEQKICNIKLIQLAKELDIKIVASNDCHLINRDDAEYRRFLMLMSKANWAKTDEDLGKLDSICIMSKDELKREFSINHGSIDENIIEESINNTNIMLDGEQFDLIDYEIKLPKFGSEEESQRKILQLINDSLIDKKLKDKKEYCDRVLQEFNVIKQAGFINYFLVVHEMFNWCRNNKIYTGVGRGSAAGSLIAYLLGITQIDPLKFELIFERFYNAGRTGIGAAPDIDSDFEDERRADVIKHLEEKYGKDNISQICNISEIKIKSGIKDCARVLEIPIPIANKITSDIDWDSYETIEQAINTNDKAKEYSKQYPDLFKYTKYFLGFPRHIGKHAAGIVISNKPINDVCPMMISKVKDENFSLSQFDKKDITNTGLIKFDILGLSTLTFLKYIIQEVKNDYNKVINLNEIDLNDSKIYKTIFCKTLTSNVFQFESDGMKLYLEKMQPTKFEDLAVLNSLYRPAGLISGALDKYISNKNNNISESTGIYELDNILSKTNYVIAFDEQKMQIVMKFGDYTLEEANYFRKHSDKFDEDYKEDKIKYKTKFVENAIKNGLNESVAEKIFEGMCGYAFCRAHAVAYAITGYWCAWFKYYYPTQFLKASFYMSKDADGNKYSIITALKMAKIFNYNIFNIDINKSKETFNFINNDIYWGFSKVKGIGADAAKIIVQNQPYLSFNDFIKKIEGKKITKRTIQPLILLGAFKDLENSQKEIVDYYQKKKYKEDITNMMQEPKIKHESELLGLVLTNKIDRSDMRLQNCINPDKIKDLPQNSEFILVAYLTDIEIKKGKSGKLYTIINLVDELFNNYEVMTSEKSGIELQNIYNTGDVILCGLKKLDSNKFILNGKQIMKLENK